MNIQYENNEALIEAVARAICIACGDKPDRRIVTNSGDAVDKWTEYAGEAKAAIRAVNTFQQGAATAKYQPASEEEIERSYAAQSELESKHPEWFEPGGFLDPEKNETGS